MRMPFSKLISALALAVATSTLATSAIAAETDSSSSQPVRLETLPETFERANSKIPGNFFGNSSILRQFEFIFGPGPLNAATYPDDEMARYGQVVYTLFRDGLNQQVSTGPIIRTPDLPNPFSSSIRQQPLRSGSRVMGSEFVYETLPPR